MLNKFLILAYHLPFEVLEISGFDLHNNFAVSLPVHNVEQMEQPIKLLGKSIADFHALDPCLTFVTLQNSSEFLPSRPHEHGVVAIYKRSGRVNISPKRYMEMMETFQPDFYTTIADADTHKNCPKRRVIKACSRSESMLDDSVQLMASSIALKNSFLIASVQGGFNQWERKRMAEHLKQHDDVIGGYFIDGLHRNGHEATSLEVKDLKEIVSYTSALLPTDKLKVMLGAYLPHVTLELIMLGVDIFDSSLVNLVTNANRALVFNFNLSESVKRFPEIDLMDSKFKDDFAPFVEGCQCLACRKHTRAYTNHLLKTHELLGPMLLTIHNFHHYQRFFEAIREAIKGDQLPKLLELVADQYRESKDILTYEQAAEDKTEKP